jgi:hypothetical protein
MTRDPKFSRTIAAIAITAHGLTIRGEAKDYCLSVVYDVDLTPGTDAQRSSPLNGLICELGKVYNRKSNELSRLGM